MASSHAFTSGESLLSVIPTVYVPASRAARAASTVSRRPRRNVMAMRRSRGERFSIWFRNRPPPLLAARALKPFQRYLGEGLVCAGFERGKDGAPNRYLFFEGDEENGGAIDRE